MPSTKQQIKKAPKKRISPPGKRLSNTALLKLAAGHRPPQEWYDDQADPTKPATGNGRGK
jgi:hypothetical protein